MPKGPVLRSGCVFLLSSSYILASTNFTSTIDWYDASVLLLIYLTYLTGSYTKASNSSSGEPEDPPQDPRVPALELELESNETALDFAEPGVASSSGNSNP